MPTDQPISLREFYEPRLARLRDYMDRIGYRLTLDALTAALEAGDVKKFEALEAMRYNQLVHAVIFGARWYPDPEAAAVHEKVLARLGLKESEWRENYDATADDLALRNLDLETLKQLLAEVDHATRTTP